ncbi:NUDIX domain-containing protein [Defluviimonas sp. WL0002]|uniref:Putative gamma-glutamylcyclotransferase n=1 Tax=Albidovulum marisflavi TaxID=2984159 RepID=A0ABT2ZDC1_9RHOB|nr:NUDIX domain-containing protein [Defluviimonas sp. WL0002]MCV2869124.1 NUDIX domain-containing protein [Defluviimonas sp. WL0002]
MADLFFYGTLCHRPLLSVVLGREPESVKARLPGHSVFWAEGENFPVIDAGGEGAQGLLVEGLGPDDLARLDHYEAGFAYSTRELTVDAQGRQVVARVYFPEAGSVKPGAPWRLEDWVDRWGAVTVEAAADIMRLFGTVPAKEAFRRYRMVLMQAASRLRARAVRPLRLRRHARPDDVQVDAWRQPYARFFAVEEYDLRFRRFDGTMSETVNRAAFISADAAVVLPYDPVRDRVLLIEQFRMGPYARGDAEPWQIESIAGRIDPDETPEEAVRREAKEEAGLTLSELVPAANYYPTPGAKAEYLYTYIGLADLPDGVAGIGGVEHEAEDIRAHLLSFENFMDLLDSGEVDNAPLLVLGMVLARKRPAIRKRHRSGA